MSKPKKEEIVINVPGIPGGNAVDYLQSVDIPISVLNRSKSKIQVDSINLRFQAEWDMANCDAIVEKKCPGFEIGPDREEYHKIQIQPTPLFMAGTNYFDVVLHYRTAGKATQNGVARRERVTYIVIHDPPTTRGQAFISFKDPEDLDLKNVMKTVAARVGFSPYAAPEDIRPGSDVWEEKIRPAIKSCSLCFLLWTGKTEFGTGVRKEIAIAREFHIKIVPMIEAAVPIPPEFASLRIEFRRFKRESAPATFSQAAMSCR